ncbi:hypothetical protein Trydic_g23782 [Trypoxylus dichotomus]
MSCRDRTPKRFVKVGIHELQQDCETDADRSRRKAAPRDRFRDEEQVRGTRSESTGEEERDDRRNGDDFVAGIISEAHLTVCGHLVLSYVSDAIRRTSKSDWKPQKIIGIHRSWQGSSQIRPLGRNRLPDRAPPTQLNHIISGTAPGAAGYEITKHLTIFKGGIGQP